MRDDYEKRKADREEYLESWRRFHEEDARLAKLQGNLFLAAGILFVIAYAIGGLAVSAVAQKNPESPAVSEPKRPYPGYDRHNRSVMKRNH